jgi:hypothetical protein
VHVLGSGAVLSAFTRVRQLVGVRLLAKKLEATPAKPVLSRDERIARVMDAVRVDRINMAIEQDRQYQADEAAPQDAELGRYHRPRAKVSTELSERAQ